MKRLYLLLLSGLLLASCVKEELPQLSEGEELSRRPSPAPLERRTRTNCRWYKRCSTPNSPKRDSRESCWNLPTNTYAFSPADSAQVARLEALDLITSYNPVGEEGRPIPEPDEDSQGEILPLYSVVPIGFQFPEDIPYTKIYDVYIQSLGGQDLLPVRRSFRPTCSKMS